MKKITLKNERYYLEDNSQVQEELSLSELIKKINCSPNFFSEYDISEEILISLVEDPSFASDKYLISVFTFKQSTIKTFLEKGFLNSATSIIKYEIYMFFKRRHLQAQIIESKLKNKHL